MTHSFKIEIAKRYGVEEAIMIHNLAYWIKKNVANQKHFYDDKYWTYCSVKAFQELFPYWSDNQIRRLLNKLEEKGIIESGNHNKVAYDRTKWYTIIDKSILQIYQIHLSKSTNGSVESHKPIPDINTYNKKEKNNKKEKSSEIPKENNPAQSNEEAEVFLFDYDKIDNYPFLGKIKAHLQHHYQMIFDQEDIQNPMIRSIERNIKAKYKLKHPNKFINKDELDDLAYKMFVWVLDNMSNFDKKNNMSLKYISENFDKLYNQAINAKMPDKNNSETVIMTNSYWKAI